MKKNLISNDYFDKINNQLINLNTKLDNIDNKIILDNWFKVFAILVPIIVGILVFYLTRKKEILFKKAEIAGEIFMRLHELRNLKMDHKINSLNQCAYDACLRLPEEEIVNLNFIKFHFNIDDIDKLKQIKEQIDTIAKELMKFLGQYKFYLSKKDKNKLNQKSIAIHITYQKYEIFKNCLSVQEIINEHEKLLLNKLFNDNNEAIVDNALIEIENLISK